MDGRGADRMIDAVADVLGVGDLPGAELEQAHRGSDAAVLGERGCFDRILAAGGRCSEREQDGPAAAHRS